MFSNYSHSKFINYKLFASFTLHCKENVAFCLVQLLSNEIPAKVK